MRCSKCGTELDWKKGLLPGQIDYINKNPVRILIYRCDKCNAEVTVDLDKTIVDKDGTFDKIWDSLVLSNALTDDQLQHLDGIHQKSLKFDAIVGEK